MIAAFTLLLFLSVDSLIGSMISAALGMPRSAMRAMIILFATCDSLATAGGQFLAPSWVHTGVLGKGEAAILFVYAALVIRIFVYMRESVPSKQNIKLFYALPLVFSLDNLAAGSGTDKGAAIWPWIAMVGVTSGLMSFLGFRIGSRIRGHLPSRAVAPICAGLLCFVALMAF